ncbi:glycosyltransferase family 4 protein [Sphingopyxis flava]|uniref:Glycosyltransferase involved in cell wall bisynthesis n=1 Tax=Sphingopyxis flava TaxID=1507287 RepID=A0A1T5BUE7_9SPHN|nr:glycosyltransferase family 4 protein [Sphingopyxis flava]SKB50982.1 Glycosyltransferase involved in cell wall bisynthesis [Sphingopyxis flava]
MPKLLMISSHFIDHGGGLERVADDLARRLAEDGRFSVTLAAHGPPPDRPGYRTLALRASGLAERLSGLPFLFPHPADLHALAKAVRTADVVVLHDNLYLTNLLAQWVAARRGKPTILIKHSGWVHSPSVFMRVAQSIANFLVVGPSLRSATRSVAVTGAKRDSLSHLASGRDIKVIENGIDTSQFTLQDVKRDIDILFVGRFVDKKGVGLVERLAPLMPECRFVCAGFGPAVPNQAKQSNIEAVERPDTGEIARLYARARVVIVPAHSEGTPLVVPESLACGTPVIASRQAAHPRLPLAAVLPIDLDWPDAIVFQWKAAVTNVLQEESDPIALREAVIAHFSLAATARQYAALIEEVLRPRA